MDEATKRQRFLAYLTSGPVLGMPESVLCQYLGMTPGELRRFMVKGAAVKWAATERKATR